MIEFCAGIGLALLAVGLGLLTTPLFPYKLEPYGAGLIWSLACLIVMKGIEIFYV